ncbi:MAG TPA: MFS transporter [Candidatus Limnocylindria bacterium]|nr:MFS transporter [Candidatus Limnocylindria bacterium]
MAVLLRERLRGVDREHVRLLGALTGGHFVVHWYQQLFSVIIPTVKGALGLDDVQVGALSTAGTLASGSAGLVSGMLGDRRPSLRPAILAGSIVVMGLGYTLLGLVPALAWAVAMVLLSGLGSGMWHPTSNATLAGKFERLRGTVLSVHGTGATVSDTVTPIVAGALLVWFHWQGVLGVQVVPALVVAWLLLRAIGTSLDAPDRARAEPHPHPLRDIATLLRHVGVLGMTAATATMVIGRSVVLTFLPIYLQEHLGYSPAVMGLYLALLHVLGIVSQPAMGVLSDRYGRKAVLVPSFTMLGALYLVLGYVPAGIPLAIVIALIGLFFYALLNVASAAMFDVVEQRLHASSWGVSVVLMQVVVLPAPIVAGALIAPFGIAVPFAIAGALVLLGGLIVALIPMRRPVASVPPRRPAG